MQWCHPREHKTGIFRPCDILFCKAPSTPTTMSNATIRNDSFDKVKCCFDTVAVFGNNVVRNFATKSKQIEHVQFVSTLSKGRNFNMVAKNDNNVEATFDFVEATVDFVERIVRLVAFDNVASTLLLQVWTGFKLTKVVIDYTFSVIGPSNRLAKLCREYDDIITFGKVCKLCQPLKTIKMGAEPPILAGLLTQSDLGPSSRWLLSRMWPTIDHNIRALMQSLNAARAHSDI